VLKLHFNYALVWNVVPSH